MFELTILLLRLRCNDDDDDDDDEDDGGDVDDEDDDEDEDDGPSLSFRIAKKGDVGRAPSSSIARSLSFETSFSSLSSSDEASAVASLFEVGIIAASSCFLEVCLCFFRPLVVAVDVMEKRLGG